MIKISREILLVLLIWIGYAYANLTSPLGNNNFELSAAELFWIRLTIVVPYLLIWIAAVVGASKLGDYARTIFGSHDGMAFTFFSRALYVLLAGMISSTLLSTVNGRWPELADQIRAPIQVTLNYMYVLFPLLAYTIFWRGLGELVQVAPQMRTITKPVLPILIFVVLMTTLLTVGIFTNSERQVSANNSATFYISDLAIVLTLILPTIGAWLLGFIGAAGVWYYQRQVKGIIYKKALRLLSIGLIAILISSMILLFLVSLGSSRLLGLGLGIILVWVYVWLIALAAGYILVALGAKKLSVIEYVK